MPFLRIETTGHVLEWGIEVPPWRIPVVGDKLYLSHALPDDKSDDSADVVTAMVVERAWGMCDSPPHDDEICLTIQLDKPLPEGHIPDSPAWPAKEHGQREREIEESRRKRGAE